MFVRRLWPVLVLSVLLFASYPSSLYAQSEYSYRIFPQLAVGGGWSADLFVTNQDGISATVQVWLFTNAGAPLNVSSNLGTGNTFTFDLEPGATQPVRLTSTAGTTPGYAMVQYPTDVSVRSSLVVRWVQNGNVMAQLGVNAQEPFYHFSFPLEFDPAKQTNTGIAVALPVIEGWPTAPQDVIVSLINQDGTLRAVKTVKMDPGEHLACFINEAPLFTGIASHNGSVSIFSVEALSVIALRLEKSALGSLTIDTGSVIAPYLVAGNESSESESNNTRNDADQLSLPACVSGVISSNIDVDYYKFTGNQGDIVTAQSVNRNLSSDIDTELFLYDSSGNFLAYDDQNGLMHGYMPSNDSFLQAELPADGTYYLRVGDFWGEGGASYSYELHVTTNGDTVTPPPPPEPVITTVTPNHGVPGDMVSLTITGTNLAGTTQVLFNPQIGIDLLGQISSNATQITATIVISPTAAPGNREIFIRNPGGTSNTLPFVIDNPASIVPTITAFGPSVASQGKRYLLRIEGKDFSWDPTVEITPMTGLTLDNVSGFPSSISAYLDVAPTAPLGNRELKITSDNGGAVTVTIQVVAPGSGGSAPIISNPLVVSHTSTSITFSFDFNDADADITWSGNAATSWAVYVGNDCTSVRYSTSQVNLTGIKSGTFNVTLTNMSIRASTQTVSIELIDAAGHISNTLTFQPGWWQCAAAQPLEETYCAGGESDPGPPSAVVRRSRHRSV